MMQGKHLQLTEHEGKNGHQESLSKGYAEHFQMQHTW